MSIARLRKVVHDRGYAKWIMGSLAVIFIVGFCLLGYGGMNSQDATEGRAKGGVVVKVNGEAVDRAVFESQYEDQLRGVAAQRTGDSGSDPSRMEDVIGPLQAEMLRGQTLDMLVNQTIVLQEAKKQGIRVSKSQVRGEIDKAVNSELDQLRGRILANVKGPKSDEALDKEIQKLKPGTSLGMLKNEIKDSIDQDQIKNRLMIQTLAANLVKGIDSSDKAIQQSFDEVHLRQFTVGTAKRSDADALKLATDTVSKIKGGADFAATAKESSDDSYKSRGGDWGFPMPKMYLPKELEEAVSKLKVGEISDPVKTAQGYVIVKLESIKSQVPKDYNDAKKKEEYKKRYLAMKEQQLQSSFFQDLRKSAKIDIVDPEMNAFSKMREADIRKPEGIIAVAKLYESAAGAAEGDRMSLARIYSQIAMIYQALRQSKTASKQDDLKYRDQEQQALDQALQFTEQNDLRLTLSDILIEKKAYDKAVDVLSYVQINAGSDPAAHQAVLQRFEAMKKSGYSKISSKIAEEQKWLADNAKMEKAAQAQMKNRTPKTR